MDMISNEAYKEITYLKSTIGLHKFQILPILHNQVSSTATKCIHSAGNDTDICMKALHDHIEIHFNSRYNILAVLMAINVFLHTGIPSISKRTMAVACTHRDHLDKSQRTTKGW